MMGHKALLLRKPNNTEIEIKHGVLAGLYGKSNEFAEFAIFGYRDNNAVDSDYQTEEQAEQQKNNIKQVCRGVVAITAKLAEYTWGKGPDNQKEEEGNLFVYNAETRQYTRIYSSGILYNADDDSLYAWHFDMRPADALPVLHAAVKFTETTLPQIAPFCLSLYEKANTSISGAALSGTLDMNILMSGDGIIRVQNEEELRRLYYCTHASMESYNPLELLRCSNYSLKNGHLRGIPDKDVFLGLYKWDRVYSVEAVEKIYEEKEENTGVGIDQAFRGKGENR